MEIAVLFIRDLAVIMLSAAIAGALVKKLGLSPIVGYLVAGIVVGTPEIAFPYVTDAERIQVLSQLGLVFLMFSIGLGLRIRRMRELGLPLVLATAFGALLVFNLARGAGLAAGLPPTEALFLAAMLMVSSSAIIGKVLQESGLTHQRHGQLAMGITLLEDIVAVVMLTFLATFVVGGDVMQDPGRLLMAVGLLVGFALLLVVGGLVLIPRALRRLARLGSAELEVVFLTGLLFLLALAASMAGYSLALGSFLAGVIVAETPRLASIQRTFSGLRDVFTTVFFVAIGMSLDMRLLPEALPLIAGGTALCIVVRVVSVYLGLLAVCEQSTMALRAALSTSPIGEFSFIIAGLGVGAGVLPPQYQVAAVGISLTTSLLAPVLIVRSEQVARALTPSGLTALERAAGAYRRFWSSIASQGQRNILWRLSRKRLIQIGFEVLFVSALLTFAGSAADAVTDRLPQAILGLPVFTAYWLLVCLLCAGSVLAIWRNSEALSLIVTDYIGKTQPQLAAVARPFRVLLQTLTAVVMLLWLGSVAPAEFRGWVLVALLAMFAVVLALNWRRINRWHSQIEFELQSAINSGAAQLHLAQVSEWGLKTDELTLPDDFAGAGRSIGELGLRQRTGCSIVSIQRQGFRLGTPSPQTHLFPGDEVLLLGEASKLSAARKLLLEPGGNGDARVPQDQHNAVMEVAGVPHGSPMSGASLAQLNWSRLHGVQVAGVKRGEERLITPGGSFVIQDGDELLLLGSPQALRRIETMLGPAPGA